MEVLVCAKLTPISMTTTSSADSVLVLIRAALPVPMTPSIMKETAQHAQEERPQLMAESVNQPPLYVETM